MSAVRREVSESMKDLVLPLSRDGIESTYVCPTRGFETLEEYGSHPGFHEMFQAPFVLGPGGVVVHLTLYVRHFQDDGDMTCNVMAELDYGETVLWKLDSGDSYGSKPDGLLDLDAAKELLYESEIMSWYPADGSDDDDDEEEEAEEESDGDEEEGESDDEDVEGGSDEEDVEGGSDEEGQSSDDVKEYLPTPPYRWPPSGTASGASEERIVRRFLRDVTSAVFHHLKHLKVEDFYRGEVLEWSLDLADTDTDLVKTWIASVGGPKGWMR